MGWWWQDELEEARKLGVQVEVLEGWGFTELFDVWSVWVEFMDKLRRHPRLGKIGKLMTVALVGRLLCGREEWDVRDKTGVTEAEAKTADCLTVIEEGERCDMYRDGRRPHTLYAVSVLNLKERGEALIHVGAWALHMAWLRGLWPEVWAAAERGDLLAYDTDAVYCRRRPPGTKGSRIGEWGYLHLRQVRFPALRWMQSDGRSKTPGQPAPRGALTPR